MLVQNTSSNQERRPNPILWSTDLSVGYGPLQIVFDASVSSYPSKVSTIIGPNGSGKSTLIKGLVGLAKVFGGRVSYQGKEITHSSTDSLIKRGIGVVPQISNVFTSLTISENLDMGGYSMPRGFAKKKAAEMLKLFPELNKRRTMKASTLSGGERQMLAVARALMTDPKVLILDEPTANLSPVSIARIHQKLKEIANTGIAILMVEQNAKKALEISDYAYIMVSGHVVYSGTAQYVLNDPEFGKSFLGLRKPSGSKPQS